VGTVVEVGDEHANNNTPKITKLKPYIFKFTPGKIIRMILETLTNQSMDKPVTRLVANE
jgi:hypothetical protein